MEEQNVVLGNKGMFQDTSISKSSNEFAYENRNIRITAMDDKTLLSITNEKGPKFTNVSLEGVFLGKCIIGDYVIIFTKSNNKDYIYRLELENNELISFKLFEGSLNFNLNNPIEAISYYESAQVQKVYWVDGINVTRSINVAAESTIMGGTAVYTGFDFNPEIFSIPNITVEKEYEGKGLFPAGTIQYYVSYYNKFSASTPIIAASGINYITKIDRGAKADEVCTCSFKLTLSNLDTEHFGYVRIYSVIRTSLDGPKEVKIVGDFSITDDTLIITDTNTNETVLADTDIYYVGGQYFIASTLDQKDNTAFFGNITLSNNIDITGIRNLTSSWYNRSTKESSKIFFDYKEVPVEEAEGIYIWDSELEYSGNNILGFKRGELYRFAIQFITKTGQWTQAFYIGDKVVPNNYPPYKADNKYYLPCAKFTLGSIPSVLSEFIGYRILIAEANYGNRRILAQGIVSPTVFNYDDRVNNRIFASSSWMIRPRNLPEVEARHYVPIINEIQNSHYNNLEEANNAKFVPYMVREDKIKWLIVITAYKATAISKNYISMLLCKCSYNSNTGKYTALNDDSSNFRFYYPSKGNNWATQIAKLKKDASEFGISVTDKLFPDHDWMNALVGTTSWGHQQSNGFIEVNSQLSDKTGDWNLTAKIPNLLAEDAPFIFKDGYKHLAYKFMDYGVSDPNQRRAYFPDEQILSFHSPELENVGSILDGTECRTRIVGIVPITANYGDFRLQTSTAGLSISSSKITTNKFTSQNISTDILPIVSPYLWKDNMWNDDGSINSDKFVTYKVYMWNREGSLNGYTPSNTVTELDILPAQLKTKLYGNMFFSNETKYLQNYLDYNLTIASVYWDDETLEPIKWEGVTKFYSGNVDTLVTMPGNLQSWFLPEIEENDSYLKDVDHPEYFKLYDPIRIKYRSTPHTIFSLGDKEILPRLRHYTGDPDEDYEENEWNLYEILADEEGDSAEMNTFAWYSNSNPLNTDFLFAGAFYMINSSEANMKQKIIDKGLTLEENKPYYIASLSLSKPIDSIYGYIDGQGTYVVCKDPNHPAYIFDFWVEDHMQADLPVHKVKTIPEGVTEEIQLCYQTEDIIEDSEHPFVGPTIQWEDPPELEDIITDYFLVIWNGSAHTVESLEQEAPEGIFSVNAGEYEYYTANSIRTPDYMEFENNHSVESSLEDKMRVHINQEVLNIDYAQRGPYLFMMELYRDSTGDELYGSEIDNLTWNPICDILSLEEPMTTSYGDTFYQRWDCLKTYPVSEEDANSVVDITSFMVESHINLDCRTDINRGTASLLNARPSNYNLFNTVYNQLNNIFQYNTLDEKFDESNLSNQIVWSIPKTILDDVDTWTQISLNNTLSLDGTYGPVNKILGVNDSLIAFQDRAIAAINYNDRTMISTESNVPIQIANSGKVDGYTYATKTNGCKNKWSICQTPSGVYFIDDNNKTLYNLSKGGLQDISTSAGMSQWFKDNTNGIVWTPLNNGYITNYDTITKDIYITNDDDCLVFNETLGSFTSFMRYEGKPFIFNLGSKSYITSYNSTSTDIYEMFGGDYNRTFDGSYIDYLVRYNVNSEPYVDKVFTNLEFIADMLDSTKDINAPDNFVEDIPFDYIDVWNEYQEGHSQLNYQPLPSNLKRKFRIWRADIPRDENSRYKLDRMRNPWINLKLTKHCDNTNKMEFHSAVVKYFK